MHMINFIFFTVNQKKEKSLIAIHTLPNENSELKN